ncbi:MAG TPA: ElyC/SanA/YdcF family protein [Candidatus Paceibacterota bacterium]
MKLKRYFILAAYGAGAVLVFIFLTNLVIYADSKPYIYRNIKDVSEAQTVVIPGAAVSSDGGLSNIFEDRVNTAIELYKAKKASKILVSGDNSTVAHNEVNPVRNYLINKGIPDEDIFLDHAGFDTYSTMYRARDIFQVSSIIVSTQSFHLPRAVFIARSLGLKAYGVSADAGHILFKNYIREIFANEKVVFNLALNRVPKFLGDVIPITGTRNNGN